MNHAPAAVWELPHLHLAQRVEIYDRLESTNTLALEHCHEESARGLAILAREQTAGRGQHGRHWQAPAGSSVLLSVLLFPPPAIARPALLTAWAAVSVCELIAQTTGLKPRIKWPNDVLVTGENRDMPPKKVCGILIEQRHRSGANAPATVVGIGLNVRQPANYFAEAQLPLAASLFSMSDRTLECDALARQLLARLDESFDSLLRGEVALLEALWIRHLDVLHRQVKMELIDAVHWGRLAALSFAGLDLENANGDLVRTVPEAVKHLELLAG